ncbi:hypothetical protein B0A52_03372 [Exophiala mesophila]|uniref:Thioredoxin domain-containing protein n=1 Tax=Exophiala mesophila TaxID=212818 RepID=A0A438N5J4_EXOME|nr:hypothetical protein B0A52_03372 [Exophiala mesophila]
MSQLATTDPIATVKEDADDDLDAVLAELENEDDSGYRAQRLEELKGDAAGSGINPTATLESTKSAYTTLKSDDETLGFTTEHERALVHFFHPDFTRCNIMDSHCQQIAGKHAELQDADMAFARVDVKDAPFVVEKLGVRVLPCVIGFVKGVVKGRITGFEGLCWDGRENSPAVTRNLEEAIVGWTVLSKRFLLNHEDEDASGEDGDEDSRRDRRNNHGRRGIQGRKQVIEDEGDDWD